jgi:hypothetical protein
VWCYSHHHGLLSFMLKLKLLAIVLPRVYFGIDWCWCVQYRHLLWPRNLHLLRPRNLHLLQPQLPLVLLLLVCKRTQDDDIGLRPRLKNLLK